MYMVYNLNMREIGSMPRTPESAIESGFVFSRREIGLNSHPANPEVYPGCLVEAMKLANRGSEEARRAVMSTVVDVDAGDSRNYAMVCGRCSLTLVKSDGIIYGANQCPKVRTGEISVSELG